MNNEQLLLDGWTIMYNAHKHVQAGIYMHVHSACDWEKEALVTFSHTYTETGTLN